VLNPSVKRVVVAVEGEQLTSAESTGDCILGRRYVTNQTNAEVPLESTAKL